MLHILRISGVLPAQKFQPPRIRVWSCPSKSGIIWISVGTKIYLVYCTSKTNICFYILQIVGNQKKKQFPPNNLTSFYREQNMRKKTFTKKTINRCYNPPPSNTAVATYNNQSAIGKKSKSFKPPPKEKKIVKLTQCTTLYSRLERITTSKSKRSWETLVQTKNQQKSRSHL